MIKIEKDKMYNEIVITGANRLYDETDQAQATCRMLDGSRDHGYAQEYIGHGTLLGLPVEAVYLLDDSDMPEDCNDEGDYDWDSALENGRIVVCVDDLDEDQHKKLMSCL
jgi:hypothetical protein